MRVLNRVLSLMVIAVCAGWLSSPAHGQWYAGPQVGGYSYPGLGYGGYGWGSAQTPMSANAIGMSALVRAQGAYNEQTSRALVNYQQAESAYIDNQQKWFAGRQSVIRAARAQSAADNEAAHAALARAEEFQAAHRPLPLASADLNPSTGHIVWPKALTAPQYDASRKTLEELFENKVRAGSNANLITQITNITNAMKDQLRENIAKMPLTDYSQARQFLDSMLASAR